MRPFFVLFFFVGAVCVPAVLALQEEEKEKECYYSILEIPRTASASEIKRAYRSMALKFHPDKAPPEKKESHHERFLLVSRAYEVLGTESTREIYDRFGHQGLDEANGPPGGGGGPADGHFFFHGSNPFEMFESFFGEGGHDGPHFVFGEDMMMGGGGGGDGMMFFEDDAFGGGHGGGGFFPFVEEIHHMGDGGGGFFGFEPEHEDPPNPIFDSIDALHQHQRRQSCHTSTTCINGRCTTKTSC
jgi:DnaJ-class molecular chaperone